MTWVTFQKDDPGFCAENTLKRNKDEKKDRSSEASAIIRQRDGGCLTEDGRVEVPQRHLLWRAGEMHLNSVIRRVGRVAEGNEGWGGLPRRELELLVQSRSELLKAS